MIRHTTFRANLKRCPLCGTKVQMEVDGRLYMDAPGYSLPVYFVRVKIKCPTEFLTLDLATEGYVAEGLTEEEQQTALKKLMRKHADEVREIWNRRTPDEDRNSRLTTEP